MAEKKDTAAKAETTEKKAPASKTTEEKAVAKKTTKKASTTEAPATDTVQAKKATPTKKVEKAEAPVVETPQGEKAPTKKVEKAEAPVVETPQGEKAPTKKVEKAETPVVEIPQGEKASTKKTEKAESSVVEKTPAKKTVAKKAPAKSGYQPRFKAHFENEVQEALQKEFAYKSPMAIPRIEKIVINMGVGGGAADKNVVDAAANDLTLLAGQKSVKTYARKSVSNFKLREGMAIGTKVTLRKNRMFDFLDKLVSVALPRVRDFRGVKVTGFDGRGNFSFGVSEQIVFPEINYDKIDKVRGMDITIVTTAKTDQEAKSLLTHFGFPFRNK